MQKYLRYGAGLIALYIIVYNGSKAGQVFKDGASGVSSVAKTLQGR